MLSVCAQVRVTNGVFLVRMEDSVIGLQMVIYDGRSMCPAMISWVHFTKQRSLFANSLHVISGGYYWMFGKWYCYYFVVIGCVLD